jgi:hypothetical protein
MRRRHASPYQQRTRAIRAKLTEPMDDVMTFIEDLIVEGEHPAELDQLDEALEHLEKAATALNRFGQLYRGMQDF